MPSTKSFVSFRRSLSEKLRRLALPSLIWLVSCLAFSGQAYGNDGDLYVAKNGNDLWSGALDAPNAAQTDGPFATLERAMQAVRQRKAAGQPSPHVLIRSGTYVLDHTLNLGPDDSGTADRPLIIGAYPGEQPVIDGGSRLPSTWQKPAQGPLWTLQLKAPYPPVEDLFLGGAKQPRSRFPSTGFFRAPPGTTSTQIQFDPGQLKAWPDTANGILIIKPWEWDEQMLPLKSIDETTHVLSVAKACVYPMRAKSTSDHSTGDYFIENVQAGLDHPGTWCYDQTKGVVTFWPPDGTDPNKTEIVAGGLPVLVSLTGDVAKKQWVEHVILDGLTFCYTGRCHTGLYADLKYFGGAAVLLKNNTRNCEVRHCLFEDLGGSGVVIWKESRDDVVSSNEFTRTGDTAINIFNILGEGRPVSSGHLVENNSIHDCGTVVRDLAGIALEKAGHCHVDHNLIYNLPYLAIRLDGCTPENWLAKESPDLKPPYTSANIKPYVPVEGNVIEFNHIHHIMQQLQDGGGVYLWGVMGKEPNIVRDNLIEHVGISGSFDVGLYLDDRTDDAQYTDNISVDASYGTHLHGAPNDLVENNFFIHSRGFDISVEPMSYDTPPMKSVIRHNIFYDCGGHIFLPNIWARWDMQPLSECDYNLFWQGGKPVTLGQVPYTGFDQHSLVADPMFKDPEHGDFSLAANSPALGLGIHPLDLSKAGLISGVGPTAQVQK